MAGSPKKRARREAAAAARAALPEFPKPSKPIEEMTPAEQREYAEDMRRRLRAELRALGADRREAGIRAGRRKPRNRAEWEMFASDLRDRRVDGDDQVPGEPAAP